MVTTCDQGECTATVQSVTSTGEPGSYTATGWANDGGLVYVDDGSCIPLYGEQQ